MTTSLVLDAEGRRCASWKYPEYFGVGAPCPRRPALRELITSFRYAVLSPTRLLRSVWLAHARDASVARCLHLPVGRWRIALCARCAALYPTLLLVLALQLRLRARLGPQAAADVVLALGGAFPALLDWSRARLGAPSPRATRLWSGALLGLALGRSIFLHWRDPPGELLVIQLALLAAGAASALLLERRRMASARDPESARPGDVHDRD